MLSLAGHASVLPVLWDKGNGWYTGLEMPEEVANLCKRAQRFREQGPRTCRSLDEIHGAGRYRLGYSLRGTKKRREGSAGCVSLRTLVRESIRKMSYFVLWTSRPLAASLETFIQKCLQMELSEALRRCLSLEPTYACSCTHRQEQERPQLLQCPRRLGWLRIPFVAGSKRASREFLVIFFLTILGLLELKRALPCLYCKRPHGRGVLRAWRPGLCCELRLCHRWSLGMAPHVCQPSGPCHSKKGTVQLWNHQTLTLGFQTQDSSKIETMSVYTDNPQRNMPRGRKANPKRLHTYGSIYLTTGNDKMIEMRTD